MVLRVTRPVSPALRTKPPTSPDFFPLKNTLSPTFSERNASDADTGTGMFRSIFMLRKSMHRCITTVKQNMSINRHAARTDANQPSIISALEAIGCRVLYIKWPVDLAVSGGRLGDQTLWVEVKMPGGRLTKDQENFFMYWPGRKCVVYNAEEAIEAVLGKALLA